jgi:hypothetical protein
MTPHGLVPNGFDPAWPVPAAGARGSLGWNAWKLLVQLAFVASAVAVAFLGRSHAPQLAGLLGVTFLLACHFASVDARAFRRLAPEHAYDVPLPATHAQAMHLTMVAPGAHALGLHAAPPTSAHHEVPEAHRVSVVAPAGMPVAARWSFAPSPGQAPDSSGTGSSSRSSTRSGRLR